MDKQIVLDPQIAPAEQTPQLRPDVRRDFTWQECEINAEDCRIKAERDPSLRDLYLAQAAYWDQLKEKLV